MINRSLKSLTKLYQQINLFNKKQIYYSFSSIDKYSQQAQSSKGQSTILQSILSFKNSNAQKHLHDIEPSQQKLKNIKQNIDYDTIKLYSQGRISFREYIFQEKINSIPVSPLYSYFEPQGVWTIKQLFKHAQIKDTSSFQNMQASQILQQKSQELKFLIQLYYLGLGKKDYQFILNEEINRIKTMSARDFEQFTRNVQKGVKIAQKQGISKPERKQDTN